MKQTTTILIAALLILEWSAGDCVGQTRAANSKAIGVAEAVRDLPDSIKTPNRYALVVGTGQYEDERISALPASLNDARRLYEVLTDAGIGMFPPENVTLLLDEEVTRLKVVSALDSLGRRAGKEDLVIVFFSGHGAVDDRGRPYWVMQNTKIDDLRASALSETEITELLGEIKTTRLVTLIDACYSASTAEIGRSKSLVDLQKIYPQFKGEGRVAITGSKGDQLSVVISDKNHPGYGYSAFTWYVIEGMKGSGDADKDGVVTVNELWSYVKDRTETTARQQGGNQQPQLKGQIGSRFLLTVDRERLVTNRVNARDGLERLLRLLGENRITAQQYTEGRELLTRPQNQLDAMQGQRRRVYADLASGKLIPDYFQAALDAIESPQQRAARLEREARDRAEQQKRQRISELLATALANDSKANGQRALAALEELLDLDPTNGEALALQVRIRGYFGPASGKVKTNSIGMKLVWIPPGEFMMGSRDSAAEVARRGDTEARYSTHEHPQHPVKISQGFSMGIHEVTQAQYEAVMGTNPSRFKGNNLPVETVSWDDATEFCGKLSQKEGKTYRLPTEAEWEYACRAGTRTPFSLGETISATQVNYDGNFTYGSGSKGQYRESAMPVGSFQPNAFGLYDMHGNVFEWCQDWYEEDYYSESSKIDPKGPQSGSARVRRGGSWIHGPWHCRSANRSWHMPGVTLYFAGFRVLCVSEY